MAESPGNRPRQRRVKPEDIFGTSSAKRAGTVSSAPEVPERHVTQATSPTSAKPRHSKTRPAAGTAIDTSRVLRYIAEVTPLPAADEASQAAGPAPAPAPARPRKRQPAHQADPAAPADTDFAANFHAIDFAATENPSADLTRQTTVAAKANRPKPRLVHENQGLRVDNIGKAFKKRPVLRGVSLTVQRGEVVGLLGPNGAGKTTCFYIVTGLIGPDYGTISLDGDNITELPMYRRSRLGIGYLPQEASIFRGLSVEANIMAVLEVVEKSARKRTRILDELLAEFSITHLRRAPAVALSGGERRRCEIARALASHPNFILLDEPFAGIDPIAVGDIRGLVSHLKGRGIGVLITDHNVRETLDIVDRAYILHDGIVLMEGGPEDVIGNEQVRRVYLGDHFSL